MSVDTCKASEFRQLTGQDTSHLCELTSNSSVYWLSRPTAEAFSALVAASRSQGFELAVASAHRKFERQLLIWNEKAAGIRPLLDEAGQVLDIEQLNEREQVFAMLRWSALPGTSRHHWGTDVDVYDAAAMDAVYRVQLCPDECAQGGIFSGLHRWLDDVICHNRSFGFQRPFDIDRGGVAPEPWHLSFAPEAGRYERMLDCGQMYNLLAQQPIALKQTVLENFEEIFRRFIAPARIDKRAVAD